MEENIYNIFAFLIVGFAFLIAGRKVYYSINPRVNNSCDSGCSGCGTPCELKVLTKSKATNL